MEVLDLRLGSPDFVQPYWDQHPGSPYTIPLSHGIKYEKDGGQPDLVSAIIKLHHLIGNAQTIGKKIVIGSGATNLIYAAVSGHRTVSYRHPYYFKFPDIVAKAGALDVGESPLSEIEIVVQPHNPLNSIMPPLGGGKKIYDYCYNWPQYVDVFKGNKDLMVFSLSKSTGHAASRIGWAICEHDSDYERIKNAIEFTSGGVSTESQARATAILNQQILSIESESGNDVFTWSKKVLSQRWERFLAVNNPKLRILNSSGMFAWCEYGDTDLINATGQFFNDYKIHTVSGITCGGKPENIRINMGCSFKDFEELIRRISFDSKPSLRLVT